MFERMWPTLQQPWYFDNPSDVALDGQGNVYVANTGNDRIEKFSSSGEFITTLGGAGGGDFRFGGARSIAFDGYGNVYVADRANHRIQKFSSSGAFNSPKSPLAKGGLEGNFGNFRSGLADRIP